MNILFLSQYPVKPNCGGIERVTFLLAEKFRDMGHKVFYISTTMDSGPDKDPNQFFVDVRSPHSKENFNLLLKQSAIDVIITQHLVDDTLILLNNMTLRPKVISVLHNRPFHLSDLGSLFKRRTYPITVKGRILKIIGILAPDFYLKQREKAMRKDFSNFLNISDKFVLLSDLFKPRLYKYMSNIDKEKVAAINNPNTFKISDDAPPKKENMVLFVGRLEDPQKNVKEFIEIWKRFHENHTDWKAVIAGDGPHKHIFENYARKKKIAGLSFVGNVKDIQSLYKKAKILCMTSLYEGWPMVLAEAMACECLPFVYDTFESAHEIISDGETGFIIPPFNKDIMIKKMEQSASNDDFMQSAGKKAKESIRQFDISKIASKWETLFQNLSNR